MKLKELISTALTALAVGSATPADAAKDFYSYNFGKWNAYLTKEKKTGVPLCGMFTRWNNGPSFFVKYIQADDAIRFHAYKPGWRFPTDGTPIEIPMTVGVDKNATIVDGKAKGIFNEGQPMVEFKISIDKLDEFAADFAEANTFWLRFDAGNEPVWSMDMIGSRGAASYFKSCVAAINKPSTQPYGAPSTQPYGKPSTQPYGEPKKDVDAPKKVKPTRETGAKKTDDGSI
jgi:hypothetical protein